MATDYGLDVYCNGDLRPDMPKVTGRSLLIQRARNGLETAPGSMDWDPLAVGWGYDLRLLVNAKIRTDLRQEEQRIVNQIERDDEVEKAEVTSVFYQSSGALYLKCRIWDADGPFSLTLSIDELTVQILNEGA